MAAFQIVPYASEHFGGVQTLWQEAFPDDPPYNRPEVSIPAKLAVQPELFFVALASERVIGTAMVGYDGHRGWLYSVAVLKSHRGHGVGTALVRAAEERLRALGCCKMNLQIRNGNDPVAKFYHRLGFATEERISMGKRLG